MQFRLQEDQKCFSRCEPKSSNIRERMFWLRRLTAAKAFVFDIVSTVLSSVYMTRVLYITSLRTNDADSCSGHARSRPCVASSAYIRA